MTSPSRNGNGHASKWIPRLELARILGKSEQSIDDARTRLGHRHERKKNGHVMIHASKWLDEWAKKSKPAKVVDPLVSRRKLAEAEKLESQVKRLQSTLVHREDAYRDVMALVSDMRKALPDVRRVSEEGAIHMEGVLAGVESQIEAKYGTGQAPR